MLISKEKMSFESTKHWSARSLTVLGICVCLIPGLSLGELSFGSARDLHKKVRLAEVTYTIRSSGMKNDWFVEGIG